MLLHRLAKDKLIDIPKWLPDNMAYMCHTGSVAYGVSNNKSDIDCCGFYFPPLHNMFPHLAGNIPYFTAEQKPNDLNVWTQHDVKDKSARKEYDFAIYGIVKFFSLVCENNPNMIDTLFVPDRCVVFSTDVSDMVRSERKQFLHKGSYHKFRGYAYQQLKRLENKEDSEALNKIRDFETEHGISSKTSYEDIATLELDDNTKTAYRLVFEEMLSKSKRLESVKIHGFDVKFGYHIVRLALEAEQILNTGELDLECNSEILKSIRRGEWSAEKLKKWFDDKERHLEDAFSKSNLRETVDVKNVKQLLMNCIEHHYGSLEKAVKKDASVEHLKDELYKLLNKF